MNRKSLETRFDPVGYLSDNYNNEVVAFNPRTMEVVAKIPTVGEKPYPADRADVNHVYVSTRGSKSLDVIDNKELRIVKTISLDHYPRSVTCNKLFSLCVVSDRKAPGSSVIETKSHKVVAKVGSGTETTPTDYGGSHATGHPFWVTNDKFLLLDRANRKIDLYKVSEQNEKYSANFINSLPVSSSVHHVLSCPNSAKMKDEYKMYVFFAISEGAPSEGIPPSLTRFNLTNNGLTDAKTVLMPTDNVEVSKMGSHHATFHPDGIHIYLGSNEGYTYVVNGETMSVSKIIETGKGNGHTTMVPSRNIAIATNHMDSFMTIMDLKNHKKIKNIEVSGPSDGKRKMQSHTSSIDPENDQYFYTAASHEGRILEIDLDKLEISREIALEDPDSYPIQGVFVWGEDSGTNQM